MKIRIKGNSVRIRLTKSEIDSFGENGYLEEHTEFGNSSLIYALKSGPTEQLSASFSNNKVEVTVPVNMTKEWTTTDIVGYDHNMEIGNGKQLYLLIEKDFKCVDAPAHEDQSDNFDHPTKVC